MADPTCIGLALTNLLTNALKYTPSGGKVVVETRESDTDVTFTVTDTGPGIPERFVPRLFERFFRIPTENGPAGAGLGLAIAREIVEAHGGQIRFSPANPNQAGSSFSYTLPVAQRESLY
jgi:two-component system sensor histidine kinase VicK